MEGGPPVSGYRGRIAPSPTGLMHVGHARTFWIAYERARAAGGVLVFRDEDLDPQRSKPEFAGAMIEDLRWLGFEWQEGPDVGGPYEPYVQSKRRKWYVDAWRKLRDGGWIYPCTCSRKDLAEAAGAPHESASNDEPMYSGKCRGRKSGADSPAGVNWRFRVPDGRVISFDDGAQGTKEYVAGRDFGDFVVWRRDGVPAYQLAVVVDDAAMEITEVVRGLDLLKSTARQILLYEAFGARPPAWYHADLVMDQEGVRLAKRHNALSLRKLRESGKAPEEVRKIWRSEHQVN
ncbi:MAG: tRNA glutamyl-Q(34) synthetase GluQRS [Proteobacteria bacterium]|nr:MAG: tRNA glutamyl-Q(34) synthetase GluQRS [Pseudomonadota bacterium]